MPRSSISEVSAQPASALEPLTIAPARVIRGCGAISSAAASIARLGKRLLIVGGDRSLRVAGDRLQPALEAKKVHVTRTSYGSDCDEAGLAAMERVVSEVRADAIVGVGGGKSLDAAKLLAHRCGLPIATVPTSAATCAAWTALSNVYSSDGAFWYDVTLERCPDLLVLDYDLIQTAPQRTLIAGIGDALAKWYEASVSSGHLEQTTIVAAVQQARVLRDLLLQKSTAALAEPGSPVWQEVVDATVLLAGVIGGLGGARCRTVAAHAVHNGLTHLPVHRGTLHGEKVAYGILVQLRLEELNNGNQLAISARRQLLQFYEAIGLPKTLWDLGLGEISLTQLQQTAEVACAPQSDIHRLPFSVVPEQLVAAMVSTTTFNRSRREGMGERGTIDELLKET